MKWLVKQDLRRQGDSGPYYLIASPGILEVTEDAVGVALEERLDGSLEMIGGESIIGIHKYNEFCLGRGKSGISCGGKPPILYVPDYSETIVPHVADNACDRSGVGRRVIDNNAFTIRHRLRDERLQAFRH